MIQLSAEAIIKQQARAALKHNHVRAIIALIITLIPLYMIDGTTTVISCAVAKAVPDNETMQGILVYGLGYTAEFVIGFMLSPVINGYIRAFYRNGYTHDMDLKDLFYYFENGRYAKTLGLNIRFILRMLLPMLLLYLPLIIYEAVCSYMGGDFYGSVIYCDFFFLLAVLSTVTTTLYSLKYFTVFTVCVDNENLMPNGVFAYSKYIMKNKTGSAAKLIFSFTPWLLLCLLILPMLYVIPYMTQSLCIAAKWMTKATFEVE